jgi:hypothetical protein
VQPFTWLQIFTKQSDGSNQHLSIYHHDDRTIKPLLKIANAADASTPVLQQPQARSALCTSSFNMLQK